MKVIISKMEIKTKIFSIKTIEIHLVKVSSFPRYDFGFFPKR